MTDQIYLDVTIPKADDHLKKRRLDFSGARNFRDLGGYQTTEGRSVRWGVLYRSDGLHKLTKTDLRHLEALSLDRVIDFRAQHEKEMEPDRFPANMQSRLVGIPILDSSTKIWHESRDEFMRNLKAIDAAKYMIQTNVELATYFTPEIQLFYSELLSAKGRPLLFHCAAGKDRTGFAAATLLKILGVSHEIIMEDYLLTNQYFLPAYEWSFGVLHLIKGKQVASTIRGFMEARAIYLLTAFEAIAREYGSFDNYVRHGLGLSSHDVEQLHTTYLE